MLDIKKHFDMGSLFIIAVTLTLFVSALFAEGLTHNVLLEAAVFLVSVKLIVMAYKNIDATDSLHQKLDEIYKKVSVSESHQSKKNNDNE